eukprot:g25271.t1
MLVQRLLRLSSQHQNVRCLSTTTEFLNRGKIVGEVLRHALNVKHAAIGDVIEVPYEITVTEAWRLMWQATFFQHDRLYTSTPYAEDLRFESCPLPYSLMLTQTVTMSHLDDQKNILDLGYDRAVYVRPAFCGQTFRKQFMVSRLKPAHNGADAVVTFQCKLFNADTDDLVFIVDKTMLIYGAQLDSWQCQREPEVKASPTKSKFLRHLIDHADSLLPNPFLCRVELDQLIIHQHQRTLGHGEHYKLSTMFRLTHPLAFNTARYGEKGIILYGALTLSTVLSLASVKLYETLFERLDNCLFVTTASPNDCIGALSLIADVQTREGGLEELTVHTIGVKNLDCVYDLKDVPIPRVLFTGKLKPSQIKQICQEECPILVDKLVLVTTRKVWRHFSCRIKTCGDGQNLFYDFMTTISCQIAKSSTTSLANKHLTACDRGNPQRPATSTWPPRPPLISPHPCLPG